MHHVKVKFFADKDFEDLEEAINDFIKDKYVIEINYSTEFIHGSFGTHTMMPSVVHYAMVAYQEGYYSNYQNLLK